MLKFKRKDMKTLQYVVITIATLFLAACGSQKVLVNYKANAEQAELTGNYEEAVTAWESYFTQKQGENAQIEGAVYADAAKTAYKADMSTKALQWFEQAQYNDYVDKEMAEILIDIYRSRNNLSKELEELEFYTENFDSDKIEKNKRLFNIYFDINMFDKALSAWERIPNDSIEEEATIEKFFLINKKRENDEVVDSVSLVLLEKNPKNVDALEWNAMKYYWKAENKYRREMKKYEQNKTGLQYVFLRKELKQVTADFKIALSYFEKLWEMNPGEKYAPYMANIHTRFDEDEKSAYYRKFLNQ